MVSRRIFITAIALAACLFLGSVGVLLNARGNQQTQPVAYDLAQELAVTLDRVHGCAHDLATAADLASAHGARQALAQAVLAFDQDLLALIDIAGQGPAKDALTALQADWHDIGPDVADLAAGEYAPSSAAGRRTFGAFGEHYTTMHGQFAAASDLLRHDEVTATDRARTALVSTIVFGSITALLGLAFWWSRRTVAPAAPAIASSARRDHPSSSEASPTAPRSLNRLPLEQPPAFTRADVVAADLDLTSVSASVDQVSVDMHTVARSTERMQAAVDSVAAALQGMLFSLNEMAQDAEEGARLTRTANNAAVYTADTARELLDTAREMSDVMGRVRDLAMRSQDVANRIESEAARSGAKGSAFTTAVAHEVTQMAAATSQSTSLIEASVDSIMANQRQYETAIGQVIRNVGVVRKVAANLGELMLAPSDGVRPGVAVVPPALEPTATATPAQPDQEPGPEAVASSALAEEPPSAPPATLTDEALDDLDGTADSLLNELADVAAEVSNLDDASPVNNEDVLDAAEVADIESATEEQEETPSAPASAATSDTVIILNRPQSKAAPEATAEVEPEPADAATDSTDEPEAIAEDEKSDTEKAPSPQGEGESGNIFMLNKPKQKV